MPKLDKGEITENLAAAIWPIGGGSRPWSDAKAAAADLDPAAMEAVNRCYHFADSTYLMVKRMVIGS